MKTIEANALQESLKQTDTHQRPRLIDVRSPGEFAAVHIEGTELIPLTDFNGETLKSLAECKESICLICASGKRARTAAEKLRAAGVEEVKVLSGGISSWEAEGLPLERGKGTISIERQVRIAAGSLVVLGCILGALIHPGFFALSGFVGAGLVFAGVTDTCGMALMLAKMPWNQGASCGRAGKAKAV